MPRAAQWLATDASSSALLDVVRAYPAPARVDWDAVGTAAVLGAAEHHRVGGFLVPSAAADGTPDRVSDHLRVVTVRRKFAQAQMATDLGAVVEAASTLTRPWAVLKGPTLVATAYDGAAREFGDLDILVDGRELEQMVNALGTAGGVVIDRNFDLLSRITSGELGVRMPAGSIIDLHWHPIHSERVRRHFAISVPELLSRVEPVTVDRGVTVPGLEATDALLYLCLHACLSGGERVLWFKDIDLVVRRLPWDEAQLAERARRWRIGAPVALMLHRAGQMFDTPVDPALLRRLCSSPALRSTGASLDRWAPPYRQRRNGHDRKFYRSVRPTAVGTALEMAKQLASERIVPARMDRLRPWRGYPGHGVTAAAIESRPGSRDEFFARVRAEAAGEWFDVAVHNVGCGDQPRPLSTGVHVLSLAPWSKADVVASLLRAAVGPRSRLAIVGYYSARSPSIARRLPARLRDSVAAIRLRELAAPLHCDAESGGLAVYYEIVTRSVYAPGPKWIPRPGDTVVDVGANIGVFSLWAADKIGATGTLRSFEPNPLAFAMLSRNVGSLSGVTTRSVALGDEARRMVLHYPPGRLSVGSFEQRPDRTESADVEVTLLDDAMADISGDIDLLKIDVEGFELPVLHGAGRTLTRTRRVVLEVAGTSLQACVDVLSSSGFTKVGQLSGMWNIAARHGVIAYFERD